MGLAVVTGFSRNMIYGFYLDPSQLGAYAMVITLSSYGVMLQLGLLNGLSRELPFLLGKGDSLRGSDLVGKVTLSSVLILSLSIALYFIILSLMSFEDDLKRTSFYLAGLVVVPSHLLAIVMLRLRSEQRQLSFALLHFTTMLIVITFGLIAIQFLSFIGAILVLIFVNLLAFVIVSLRFLKKVNYSFLEKKDFFYLLRIGFPLMVTGLIVSLIMSVDKLFLIRFATASDLGIYQIGLLPVVLGISLNSIANQYIYPKLLFEYGQGALLNQLFKSSLTYTIGILGLMILLAPFVLFTLRFFINSYLPAYSQSIFLLDIFYLSGVFLAMNLGDIICEVVKKTKILVYQNIAILILALISYSLIYNESLIYYAYVFLILSIIKLFSSYLISYLLVRKYKKV